MILPSTENITLWYTHFSRSQGFCVCSEPFRRQPRKMVKHTQTICRLLPTNYLNVFNRFVRLVLKGFTLKLICLWNGIQCRIYQLSNIYDGTFCNGTIFTKCSIIDFSKCPKYTAGILFIPLQKWHANNMRS